MSACNFRANPGIPQRGRDEEGIRALWAVLGCFELDSSMKKSNPFFLIPSCLKARHEPQKYDWQRE